MSAGFNPADIGRQTPAMFASAMRGARARLEREQKDAIGAQYAGAVFTRTTKLKPLKHYLKGENDRKVISSADEARAFFESLAARGLGSIKPLDR